MIINTPGCLKQVGKRTIISRPLASLVRLAQTISGRPGFVRGLRPGARGRIILLVALRANLKPFVLFELYSFQIITREAMLTLARPGRPG